MQQSMSLTYEPSAHIASSVLFPDRLRGEVSRGEKMLFSGTDPESYITEYTLVYEDDMQSRAQILLGR